MDTSLNNDSWEYTYWSTSNVGEAFPGVMLPLGWDLLNRGVEGGIREAYFRLGLLPRKELSIPDDSRDRILSSFYGRGALNINFFAQMGSAWPGIDQTAFVEGFLGKCPKDLQQAKSLRRVAPFIVRGAWNRATVGRRVYGGVENIDFWWKNSLEYIKKNPNDILGVFNEARLKFTEMLKLQAVGLFLGVQGPFTALEQLLTKYSIPPSIYASIWGGQGGHVEAEMIKSLWLLGKGFIDIATFLESYGFHGPNEGDISGIVWREDPTPVNILAAKYAESVKDPDEILAARARERRIAERYLLASLPLVKKPRAWTTIITARKRIPMRGVAKRGFLQALDVLRACVRMIGQNLCDREIFSHRSDVFFLQADELLRLASETRSDHSVGIAQEKIKRRRCDDLHWRQLSLPESWKGLPEVFATTQTTSSKAGRILKGNGVSNGVVTGSVKVVDENSMSSVEEGDIVVCRMTDPSWTSVLLLCGGIIADTGGALSHAAVMARELGIPCVIGTGNAVDKLSNGDIVCMNGATGEVHIL